MMQTETMTIPKAITPLIETLDHVIIITDGVITKNTADDLPISLENSVDQTTLIKYFKSDNPIITNNQQNHVAGLSLNVKPGTQVKDPVHIVYIHTKKSASQNLLINVGANAELTLNEYIMAFDASTVDYVSQVHVGENAHLNYHGLVNLNRESLSSINRLTYAERYANLKIKTAQLGHGNTQQDTRIDLHGEHAVGEIKTVALTSKTQEAVIRSIIEHHAKKSEGLIEQYGVAADESFLMFEGIGKIHKGMSQSMAFQHNKGVVLGANARLDANPLLLIDEYDVEAGHGAAIGKIDDEQLYYLMSRGLSEKDAQRLIIHGYLHPIEPMMSNDTIKAYIEDLLKEKTT